MKSQKTIVNEKSCTYQSNTLNTLNLGLCNYVTQIFTNKINIKNQYKIKSNSLNNFKPPSIIKTRHHRLYET